MPKKLIILNNLQAIFLLAAQMCCVQLLHAQVNDTVPATTGDSIVIIKQWVKEYLLRQWQQCDTRNETKRTTMKQLLNNSIATDSMGTMLLQDIRQVSNTLTSTGSSVTNGTLNDTRQLLQQQVNKLMEAQDINSLISRFTGMVKQPLLEWKATSVNITGETGFSLLDEDNIITSNTLAGSWLIMGIPVAMQFMHQDLIGSGNYFHNTFSFRFDRTAWLNSFGNTEQLKVSASALIPAYNSVLQKMKEEAMARLMASLDSVKTAYKGKLNKQLETLGGAETILKTGMNVLEDKMLPGVLLQNTEQNKNMLLQMQQQLNAGGSVNINLYDSLLQSVQTVQRISSIINILRSFKAEMQKIGLQELQQAEEFKNNNMQQWLQQPDKLVSLARQQFNLNGVQKLLLNMQGLSIGMNTVHLSPLSVYQFAGNGFNAAFVNNKTYLFVMAEKQQAFNNLFDNRFTSALFTANNTVMGIRTGKGDITGTHTHISLFTYKENSSSNNNTFINTVPGNTMVTTFSSQLKLNEPNFLDLEISGSSHKYNNQQNIYDSLQQGGRLPKQLLGGKNFIQQMAFSLQWNAETKEKGLSYDLHGTATGKAYANPGNPFISSGTTMFGGSLKKNFLQNKWQLSAKGNYSQYQYTNNNTQWHNYDFSLQGKWKFKRGQFISFYYQLNQSQHLQNGKNYIISDGNRLLVDGNFRKRLGSINYQHTVSCAVLTNGYRADSLPTAGKSFFISSMQAVTINRKSYYLNMQYNRSNTNSGMVLCNTQFNADAGFMYNICKGILASTAVNYNSIKEWFQQLGIKQTVNGHLGERCSISLYADITSNIKKYQAGTIGNSCFHWSLQYLLK